MAESDPGKDASLHGGIMEETGNAGFQDPPPVFYLSVSFKDTALSGNRNGGGRKGEDIKFIKGDGCLVVAQRQSALQ